MLDRHGRLLAAATPNRMPGEPRAAPAPDGASGACRQTRTAYAVFPDADAGADPSVPADQGGRGFTGEGWDTNTDYDLIGDPRAVKGGVLRQAMMTDFPGDVPLLRPERQRSGTSRSTRLVYESLLYLHPTTLEYIPGLATHWQISDDRRTYRFRINPNARWSDGMPVTADDVVASWRLAVDKALQDPARNLHLRQLRTAGRRKQVHRLGPGQDARTGRTSCTSPCGAHIGGLFIYAGARPEGRHRRRLTSSEYNYRMLPGTGPYHVSEQDVERGRSIRIRRRNRLLGGQPPPERRHREFRRDPAEQSSAIATSSSRCSSGATSTTTSCSARRMGPGAELSEHQARPEPEAQDLQPQSCRHRRASR